MRDQKASTTGSLFSRETSAAIHIEAPPAIVWRLLTDAGGYPRWTSTVRSIRGRIRRGETIQLRSALDEKRTFKLVVLEADEPKVLVWGDRQGKRHHTLTPLGTGTHFSMRERIGGALFPLYGRFIPSFDQSFDQLCQDLKRAAEAHASAGAKEPIPGAPS